MYYCGSSQGLIPPREEHAFICRVLLSPQYWNDPSVVASLICLLWLSKNLDFFLSFLLLDNRSHYVAQAILELYFIRSQHPDIGDILISATPRKRKGEGETGKRWKHKLLWV